jgi:hypothetical protein
LLEWKIFQTKVVENLETHFVWSITSFENREIYEISWKNFVEQYRPQMTIWCMRIACWVMGLKEHTIRLFNTYCFPTTTTVARTPLNVTLYVNWLSLLWNKTLDWWKYIMDQWNSKIAGVLELTFHFISLFPSAVFRGFMSALLAHLAVTGCKYISADVGCRAI